MQLVHPAPENTEVVSDRSPLASARLHRRLTIEEVAKRAGVTRDQVEWLEEGRVYRFPSVDSAIETTLLVAAALDIDRREARRLAGLPVPPRPLDVNPTGRLVGVAAISAALMALVAFVLVPALSDKPAPAVDPVVAQAATLPEALEGPGRRPERCRRHHLDTPGREPDPVARLHGQEESAAPTASTTRSVPCTTRPAAA